MRICYLANAASIHTVKFSDHFRNLGHEIFVISLNRGEVRSATVFSLDAAKNVRSLSEITKLGIVVRSLSRVRALISEINPDILHAHYGSSYGLLALLVGIRPFILSLWGSDVFEFPRRSMLHRLIFRRILASASMVLSTSQAMRQEILRYCRKKVTVTPFGVDVSMFCPAESCSRRKGPFTIATAKMLEPVYGLGDLIDALALVHAHSPQASIRLEIGGTGSQEKELKQRAQQLGLGNRIVFLGWLDPCQVAELYQRADVAVFPSLFESFCVSAVEAQACGTPVIATDVGGLPEATLPGRSALLVQPRSVEALAAAIERLLKDPSLRSRMGAMGRAFVVEEYDIRKNLAIVARIYDELRNAKNPSCSRKR